jgi:hypothetical protein
MSKIYSLNQNKVKYLILVTVEILERQVHLGCNDTKEETENMKKCEGRYVTRLPFIAEIYWLYDVTVR